MTLSTTAARVSYSGNGSSTTFGFSFKIWAFSDLKVYLRDNTTLVDTLQVYTTDYTIDISSYPNTRNVVFVSAPATGKTIVILRDQALTQDLALTPSGAFAATNVETQLDKLVGETQTLRQIISRIPQLPAGTALSDLALPEPSSLTVSQVVAINAAGTGFESKTASSLNIALVSSYMASLLDDTTAAIARVTLGLLDSIVIAFSDETTAITTGTAKVTFFAPYDMTVTEMFVGLGTQQASGTIFTVNVKKNGSTMLSTKITVDNAEDTSLTAATPPVLSVTSIAKGDKITVDVDQIGNGTAKSGKLVISGYRA